MLIHMFTIFGSLAQSAMLDYVEYSIHERVVIMGVLFQRAEVHTSAAY